MNYPLLRLPILRVVGRHRHAPASAAPLRQCLPGFSGTELDFSFLTPDNPLSRRSACDLAGVKCLTFEKRFRDPDFLIYR